MVVLLILLIIQFSTRSYSLWNLRILSSCQRNMPLKHYFKSCKTNNELLKKCQVNQLSITTTPIRFNLLQVCPYLSPFEFTVLLMPSFHVVSSNFCFSISLVVVSTVEILIIVVSQPLKGAVSRNSAKLRTYKMLLKFRET